MANEQKNAVHHRGQWASKFGFLMAAVGSAVGLGNIWGFPYKMGKSGGFAFLVIYLALALMVGVMVMLGELALGRKTRQGGVGTWRFLTKRFAWIGYVSVAASFFIMAFYSVLGGMIMKYMVAFAQALFNGGANFAGVTSGAYFGGFICNAPELLTYFAIFQAISLVIVMGGVESGIERFNKYALPALVCIMIGLAAYILSLPGALGGIEFMFRPNLAVFSDPEIGFFKVLKTAAGQMFFSLSLGCSYMI
ncbi:MAG: sodium-dependent transporter, partial [Pyramidobacter sp.]|nr:sodium-dependent transporter [Pyramidobacter sp.]